MRSVSYFIFYIELSVATKKRYLDKKTISNNINDTFIIAFELELEEKGISCSDQSTMFKT